MTLYVKIGQDGNFWLELIDHIKISPHNMSKRMK